MSTRRQSNLFELFGAGARNYEANRAREAELAEKLQKKAYDRVYGVLGDLYNRASRDYADPLNQSAGDPLVMDLEAIVATTNPEGFAAAGNKVTVDLLNSTNVKNKFHELGIIQYGVGNFSFFDKATPTGQQDDNGNDILNISIAEFRNKKDRNAPGTEIGFRDVTSADPEGTGSLQMTIPQLDKLIQDYQHHVYRTVNPSAYNVSRRLTPSGFVPLTEAEQERQGSTGMGKPRQGAFLSDQDSALEIFQEVSNILQEETTIPTLNEGNLEKIKDTILGADDAQLTNIANENNLNAENLKEFRDRYQLYDGQVRAQEELIRGKTNSGDPVTAQDRLRLTQLKRTRDRYIGTEGDGPLGGTLAGFLKGRREEVEDATGSQDRRVKADGMLSGFRREEQQISARLSSARPGSPREKQLKKQLEDVRTKIDNRINTLGDGPQRKTQFTQEDIAGILDGAFTANGGTPYVAIEKQISNMLEMKGYEINERTKAKIDNYITQNFSPQSQRVKLSRDPNTEPANNRQRAIIDSENIRDGMAILLALPEQSRTNLSPASVEMMANTFKLTGTFDVEAYKALLDKQLAADENYRKQHGTAIDVINKLKNDAFFLKSQYDNQNISSSFRPDDYVPNFKEFYATKYDDAEINAYLQLDRIKGGGKYTELGRQIVNERLQVLGTALKPILDQSQAQSVKQYLFSFGNEDYKAAEDLLTGKYRIQVIYANDPEGRKFLQYEDIYNENGVRRTGGPSIEGFRFITRDGQVAGDEIMTLDALREGIDDLGGDYDQDITSITKALEDLSFLTNAL